MARQRTPTVTMPDELVNKIDDQLEYGDSRAAWIRAAARERLRREGAQTDNEEATDA
jgi:Arc/MetJ-type ribon-helix-helix transcriptional regulator